MNELICYWEPGPLCAIKRVVSQQQAISMQKHAAHIKGHAYQSDGEALQDFITVNSAWMEEIFDGERWL